MPLQPAGGVVETDYRFSKSHDVVAAVDVNNFPGDTAAGVAWIEDGIRDWLETGAVRIMPFWLSLKAEVLYLAGRTPEALETIKKALTLSEESGEREWYPELQRLRGVFLAAIGANKAEVEAAFGEAIRTAQQQTSVSLLKRAEASHAEYRSQREAR